jgi:RHS repeat-associated protein
VGAGATMTYNEDNRMSSAQEPSGSLEYYYYTPDGKRFCRQMADGDTQYTLYGVQGEALGTYAVYNHTELSVYFGGRRLWQAPYYDPANYGEGAVFADRLGSNRYVSTLGYPSYLANYYPYGDVSGTAPQDQVGFATYTQDSYTGLDYADQRFYASSYGRFLTPDPAGRRAVRRKDPGSWNRYAYTRGDPVNRRDKRGLDDSGGDDGCVELDDGTYDCGLIAIDNVDGSDDGDGSDFFDDPEYAEECLAEFQECEVEMSVAQQMSSLQQAALLFLTTSNSLRNQAASAIQNLSPNCQTVLGGMYNLYNGNTSLLYEVNAQNPNAPTFIDVNSLAGITSSFTTVGYWTGNGSVLPVTTAMGTIFAGLYSTQYNTVLVGSIFDSMNQQQQNDILLHEVMHAYTGLGDVALAAKLGLGSFANTAGASIALNNFFSSNCNH